MQSLNDFKGLDSNNSDSQPEVWVTYGTHGTHGTYRTSLSIYKISSKVIPRIK